MMDEEQAHQVAIATAPDEFAEYTFPLRYRSEAAFVFGCVHPDGQRRTGGLLIWVDRATGDAELLTFPKLIPRLAGLERVSSDA